MFNFYLTIKEKKKWQELELQKQQRLSNMFNTGADVTWKTLRNKFELQSVAMVGKLRNEGMMIYENRSSNGVSYRVGTPSKAI